MLQKHKSYKAILGLGNPGPKYFFTPHNIGFLVVDEIARLSNADWIEKQNMLVTTVIFCDQKIMLIKPTTFMNSSGQVLAPLKKQGISLSDILVIHDEIDFDFGKIAVKESGSARGHNGLRSLIEHAGSDFVRVRCGVGRPDDRAEVGNFVLAPFKQSPHEVTQLIESIIIQIKALIC